MRTGKIAHLPHAIRDELNHRLLDNQPNPKILAWLNSLPEQQGQPPITKQNLYQWRMGGFDEWLEQQRKLERLLQLAERSGELTKAGSDTLTEGAAVLFGAELFDLMQSLDWAALKSEISNFIRPPALSHPESYHLVSPGCVAKKFRVLGCLEQRFGPKVIPAAGGEESATEGEDG
jgi:hypothetical protein